MSAHLSSLVNVSDGITPTQVHLVDREALDARDVRTLGLASIHQFNARAGETLLVTDEEGVLREVLVGTEGGARDGLSPQRLLSVAVLNLPGGVYELADAGAHLVDHAAAWALGQYRFDRYKSSAAGPLRKLRIADTAALEAARQIVEAQSLVRDLINTPAEHMGPSALEQAAETLAVDHDATVKVIRGDKLLESGFPAIHAVGRAATRREAPRLIELTWSPDGRDADQLPSLALVGKGVCFDSGGLNIKPVSGMRWMKKDMGGAAHVLGLASLIMQRQLPLRLRVLIPAVENAISAGAFRPGDVLETRKGISVEVGNTDAEGRLVLSDALTFAAEAKPDLILDFATLTGAARVALGPDVMPAYTADDQLWQALESSSRASDDPLWRMPLYQPYLDMLESQVADMCNISGGNGFAGSVLAALFLQQFAGQQAWAHFDIFGWSPSDRPGRPAGGAVQGLMAAYGAIEQRLLGRGA